MPIKPHIPALFLSDGTPVLPHEHPRAMTASFLRSLYVHADVGQNAKNSAGYTVMKRQKTHVRIQQAYVIRINVYESKFQVQPDEREYFLYADASQPGMAAFRVGKLWELWEKEDKSAEYPKCNIDFAACGEIDDNEFDDLWKAVQKAPHRAAGDPRDPFGFTATDGSVKLFRTEDLTKGLAF